MLERSRADWAVFVGATVRLRSPLPTIKCGYSDCGLVQHPRAAAHRESYHPGNEVCAFPGDAKRSPGRISLTRERN
ncbi:hypothetical protein KM043_009062 [Ampulex compressa]|nr:hypothetical protein KM043_009062 [Ampulex compressa]